MSSNSRSRTINYTPRMTQMEAFDLLAPRVREFLRGTVTEWDTLSILKFQKKNTVWQTLEWLAKAEAKEIQRSWYRGHANPVTVLGLKPLRPNYADLPLSNTNKRSG